MNAGYNGSTGHNLDVTIAPRALPNSPDTDPDNLIFNYEEATGFSHFNAGTLRLNKRLSNGVSLGINYQYSHSIDDAGSVGGTTSAVAQNWQDIRAEESNSSYDQRHKASGTYLFELPFGKDKRWLTAGTASHLMEGFSISGTFTFASGTPTYSVLLGGCIRCGVRNRRQAAPELLGYLAGGGWITAAMVQCGGLHRACFERHRERSILRCFRQRFA